ncbi:methyltransferase-like protein 27 [Seriola aureovittata]|uniref:methyltransferase-like protein 27 n=1 Tax=Seriola aureovittata TaxID=2871759 RepID=UPI0024BDE096|nr:methyltransferase-like protein 27 [Seriola aureovittata]XP_056252922.1 methyltransferase-like protein 27 [Seriola aureovittata]XP_056252923.1 methyltransferase-like protein 27 [Seriola aureovittata]XP_056252924.1 methyltransferase-like protein 27 [Seriola aureovittata]XP_056252925.1 methyltransferase-like protein 27 [Seriola aureovittata]XP_056252926.1 methyltransferase-like protein 27 [Seriola aureovittata]XP_056252927.1 methyltransferase-like protein 27 [Seriola aureovittata]
MALTQRTFETVKGVVASVRGTATVGEKMAFYDTWAGNYDQDVAVLDYHAASQAASVISSYFSGDREAAVVLDVACGTGLVAKQMKLDGFGHFVGIDGSKAMLDVAQEKELYQDLKQCILGEQLLPAKTGSFDLVVICGALSVDHVPLRVVRELCSACKPGGYVCMTCRHGHDNLPYKAALERELKQMEEEGLWSCVAVTEVENWAREVSGAEGSYISGSVYLYKKL